MTLANSAKTSISQIQQLSSSLYHTTLTVSDLSQSDDAGEYSCEALVAANPSSSYIATSSVASVSLTLTIQQGILPNCFEERFQIGVCALWLQTSVC